MTRDELKNIIPHREPMLLLDEAWREGSFSVGTYAVRGDEFFLQGHFPGNPVVPGVILCEMMAQAACLLIDDCGQGATPYYTGMNTVRFKRPVHPGEVLEFRTELTAVKKPFYFIKGTGMVGGAVAVSGEFSFAVIKGE